MSVRERAERQIRAAQDAICSAVEALDGTSFSEHTWERPGGGGGRSRVIQEGRVFEKAGVNASSVHGVLSDGAARAMSERHELGDDRRFFATGVSLVLHPRNPMAPTAHANYRYFEVGDGAAWWFGGGADLTPAYLFEDDVRHFHGVHKAACDAHDLALYPTFKAACDDYFHIVHRGERRGVGGIFFDDLCDRSPDDLLALHRDLAAAFVPAYLPLVERHQHDAFSEAQRDWQQIRRGRYVEFNLVYDRGTLFGLRTNARIESVLMSLPLTARWEVDHQPEPGSPEAALLAVLRDPVDWV